MSGPQPPFCGDSRCISLDTEEKESEYHWAIGQYQRRGSMRGARSYSGHQNAHGPAGSIGLLVSSRKFRFQ